VALLSGCGNDSRLFIVQNQVPTASCEVNTNRTLYQGSGFLDVALVDGAAPFAYELFPLLENDYPGSAAGGAQSNRLFVRAFRVEVEAPEGVPAAIGDLFARLDSTDEMRSIIKYQTPWAGTIDPGGGLMAADVGVVPAELARRIRATKVLDTVPSFNINARVKAVGQRRDGDVESAEFVYPIRVCQGCLISGYPNLAACPFTTPVVNQGNPCNISQDGFVDCCQAGVELICPAVAVAK
jgi:hypothetical protein